jgi:ABC-type nitrate/sulfonate/bicarbonate transport system substrate-binding protein
MPRGIDHDGPSGRSAMKRLASAAIVTAALLATPALAQPQKVVPEKSKVTLAVGGRTAMVYLALTIAWHKGFFRDEGIDFSFFDVSTSAPVSTSTCSRSRPRNSMAPALHC